MWRVLKNPFAVKRFGLPIDEVYVKRKFDPGIAVETTEGLVSEYEEREAAVYSGYTWREWLDLHWYDRASCIAHHRLHNTIELHVSDAAESAAKSKGAKK